MRIFYGKGDFKWIAIESTHRYKDYEGAGKIKKETIKLKVPMEIALKCIRKLPEKKLMEQAEIQINGKPLGVT